MKKGISLIALIATVAITLILVTTISISGIGTANNAKRLAFSMEIKMIQDSVDSYYVQNGEYPCSDLVVLNLENLNANDKAQFLNNGETVSNNQVNLYKIDYSKTGLTDLKYGDLSNGSNDIYVVSKKSGKVYYAKGVKIGNTRYFTTTEELENILNYNSGKNDKLANNAVLFESSTTEWTNSSTGISVTVKVPNVYSSISITPTASLTGEQDDYKVYNVSVKENTTIIVSYKLKESDTDTIQAKYTVSNIDKVAPVVNIDSKQIKIDSEDNIVGYIKISSIEETLSGIKTIKYCNGNIAKSEVIKVIEKDGVEVSDNMIPINSGVSTITLYVEDNAGNVAITYINVTI